MIRPLLAATLLAGLTLAPAAAAPPKAAATPDLAKAHMNFLRAKGLEPVIDQDGDVAFDATPGEREFSFYIDVQNDDPAYFRLVLPRIWSITSDAERQRAQVACNVVNIRLKVVKCSVVEDAAWLGMEMLLSEPSDYQPRFDRMLQALDQAGATFAEAMKSSKGE